MRTLDGIEAFTNLTHLSVSYNKLGSIEELAKIPDARKIENLSIKGN